MGTVQNHFVVFKGLRLGDRWRLRLKASNSCMLSCPLFIIINSYFLLNSVVPSAGRRLDPVKAAEAAQNATRAAQGCCQQAARTSTLNRRRACSPFMACKAVRCRARLAAAYLAKGLTSRPSQDLATPGAARTSQKVPCLSRGNCCQDAGTAQDISHTELPYTAMRFHAQVCKETTSSFG